MTGVQTCALPIWLGTGGFELRHDGTCRNWTIFNNQPQACGPRFPWDPANVLFFVVRCHAAGQTPRLFLLQIEESHGAAAIEGHEHAYVFPWLTGLDRIVCDSSFPYVRLACSHADMPLAVELEAWSPFIPRNVKDSALPAAIFDLRLRSTAGVPVEVSVLASMRHCVGYDISPKRWINRLFDDDLGQIGRAHV